MGLALGLGLARRRLHRGFDHFSISLAGRRHFCKLNTLLSHFRAHRRLLTIDFQVWGARIGHGLSLVLVLSPSRSFLSLFLSFSLSSHTQGLVALSLRPPLTTSFSLFLSPSLCSGLLVCWVLGCRRWRWCSGRPRACTALGSSAPDRQTARSSPAGGSWPTAFCTWERPFGPSGGTFP